jgi:hypothetical protein
MLNEFAIVGEADEVITGFKQRFGKLVDRTTMSLPARDEDHTRDLIRRLTD